MVSQINLPYNGLNLVTSALFREAVILIFTTNKVLSSITGRVESAIIEKTLVDRAIATRMVVWMDSVLRMTPKRQSYW